MVWQGYCWQNNCTVQCPLSTGILITELNNDQTVKHMEQTPHRKGDVVKESLYRFRDSPYKGHRGFAELIPHRQCGLEWLVPSPRADKNRSAKYRPTKI